ncbi:patched domain-containing protein 3 [Eurytemora carolleeae]|uniref:patched domain-containing protein 3 n=1 Tax=Eurytemora carolleeae TaxID=1294199 RepID=UPI000C791378|nr:patched domain-containing protein 3 [Eurytemora carolleeae]|eukprot:XP_023324202.1 patched domain-containing protein 3-like [Eurytemora affinis]
MMEYFRDVLAPLISNKLSQLVIILAFTAYLAVAVYGITQLTEGLERKKLVGDFSYALPFFQSEDDFFRDNPYRLQIVVHETLDYSNKTVQGQVLNMIHQLEDSGVISNMTAFRQSWLHEFLAVVEKNFLLIDVSTPQTFVENLFKFLVEIKDTPLYGDVVFSPDKKSILASRFFLQSSRIRDAKEDVHFLKTVREIVDSAPFNVTIFHPFFQYFDQFSLVLPTTISCIVSCCICMSVITFFFIPNKICVIWVTFTVISVEIGVVGFMALAGINLDVISMIVLIMGIGFSVDFSAHISYHYLSAGEGLSPETKLKHCLHALGPAIIRGGSTTLLGVVGLIFHPSYITITFSRMIFMIIILGMLHGLLLLPVLLGIFGPGFCSNVKNSQTDPGLLSPTNLSETFTYQSNRARSGSLRKLVLTENALERVRQISVQRQDLSFTSPETINSLESDQSDWSQLETPNYRNLRGYTPPQNSPDSRNDSLARDLDFRPRSNTDGLVFVDKRNNISPSRCISDIADPLPYYKFAHVKRSPSVRDSRHEHIQSEDQNSRKADIRVQRKFPEGIRYSDCQDLEDMDSTYSSSEDDTLEVQPRIIEQPQTMEQ